MSGNRGAKGSVNDRIISFLYRKRYLEYLKKKESYTKEERERAKEYLKRIKYFDIDDNVSMLDEEDKNILNEALSGIKNATFQATPSDNYYEMKNIEKKASSIENSNTITEETLEDLSKMGKKVSEYDPLKEQYDFDKYDYYEVISNKTGLSSEDENSIDVDKEIEKKADEEIIIDEVEKFIDESKQLLVELKEEITSIKEDVSEIYTAKEIDELKERYNEINQKIQELKEKYSTIKEKYDFEGYEILDNLLLVDTIDDYKNKADLEEIELLIDACKYEVESISGITIEDEISKGVSQDIEEKKGEIVKRDNEFKNTKDHTIYLDSFEKMIQQESIEQQKIILELEKDISHVEEEIVRTTEYVYHTGRMFGSFLRIATGILTAPFSNNRFLGVMLGTHLINRGLRELRTSLIPEEVQRVEVRTRYNDVEREILHAKDDVKTTLSLINDSLYQVGELKKTFDIKLKKYSAYIPNYYNVEQMLNDLENKLNKNKDKINNMNESLDKQYEANKQNVYRANNPRNINND